MRKIKMYPTMLCVICLLFMLSCDVKAGSFVEGTRAAQAIECGTLYSGELVYGTSNWYKIKTNSDYMNYHFLVSSENANVCVYDENGTRVGTYYPMCMECKLNPQPGKEYYIAVSTLDFKGSNYTLKVECSKDASNSRENPTVLPFNTLTNDGLYSDDDVDWFVVKTPFYEADYTLIGTGSSYATSIVLYDSNLLRVASLYSAYYDKNNQKSVTLSPNRTYYICVSSDFVTGYTLRLDMTPIKKLDRPEKVNVSRSKKKASVKWDAVVHASGYEIRYADNKNMKKAKTIKVKSAKGTVKKLNSSKKYYIQVRAYTKKSNGKMLLSKWSRKVKV